LKKKDLLEKEENAKRSEKVKRDFEEDRQTWDEKVEMTGGVKPSIAQEIPERQQRTRGHGGVMPGIMPMVPGMGGPPGMPPPGMGGPPPPAPGGHVLGGEEDDE